MTALLWAIVSVSAVGISAMIRTSAHVLGEPSSLDLWVAWIQPALKTTQVTETDLLPAVFVNLFGIALGFAGSLIVTSRRGGRLRSFNLWHLRFDLTPRVWNWFFQEPVQGRLYRIRLSSGDQLIGQITAYSINPDDDVQEIIVELFSRGGKEGPTQAVTDARRLLVSRSEIETIEQLRVALQIGPAGLILVPIDD